MQNAALTKIYHVLLQIKYGRCKNVIYEIATWLCCLWMWLRAAQERSLKPLEPKALIIGRGFSDGVMRTAYKDRDRAGDVWWLVSGKAFDEALWLGSDSPMVLWPCQGRARVLKLSVDIAQKVRGFPIRGCQLNGQATAFYAAQGSVSGFDARARLPAKQADIRALFIVDLARRAGRAPNFNRSGDSTALPRTK